MYTHYYNNLLNASLCIFCLMCICIHISLHMISSYILSIHDFSAITYVLSKHIIMLLQYLCDFILSLLTITISCDFYSLYPFSSLVLNIISHVSLSHFMISKYNIFIYVLVCSHILSIFILNCVIFVTALIKYVYRYYYIIYYLNMFKLSRTY